MDQSPLADLLDGFTGINLSLIISLTLADKEEFALYLEFIKNQAAYPNSEIFSSQGELEQNPDNQPIGVTKTIKKGHITKRKYDNISDELRLKLLDAVLNKGEKIKHVNKSALILFI